MKHVLNDHGRDFVLESLAGLDNLTSVGSLTVYNNDALTSLAGIDNLTGIGGAGCIIRYNDALPQCEVDAFVANLYFDFVSRILWAEPNGDTDPSLCE